MEIIITHEGTDFDGLAAMIAATKVYPEAIPVFPGYLSHQVKKFMALFKDQFLVRRPKDINFAEVRRIILVDTKDPSRVGPFGDLLYDPKIEKIVYDHHLLDQENFDFEFIDYTSPVGSSATILTQIIKNLDIRITSQEATLFALGIYHDTGCLTYPTTSALDAEMVAFLLRAGASLNVVEEFVDFALNEAQQDVLNILFDQVENLLVKGLRVDLYSAVLPNYLLGINNIIHKLQDIREADLYFVIVEMEGRVLVVARSAIDSVHLGQFLQHLGGGGHPGAASAVIKGATLAEIIQKVKDMLEAYISLPRLAKDIMTSPVKTIPPEALIWQAEEIMLRYGHSGLIVMDQNEIKGIFSRRDLDKVKKHQLSNAPIKGYMTRKVITIAEQAPLSEVQNLMVSHDIGRLPVIDEAGQVVGIITRSDLLNVLYGDGMAKSKSYYGSSLVETNLKLYNLTTTLAQSVPELYELFCQIRDLSQELNVKPFLVGGFVRDLLIQRSSKDLDLVIEGDGLSFAQKLQQIIGGQLTTYPEFATATLDINGFHLDIVTARREYYEYPAALPQVEPGHLKQDLYRRDFTINTLAIALHTEKFGCLLDFFCGKRDLEKGIIRGLHSFTFIDDPTRILRGIKFAVRFDFVIEEETNLLIHQAIQQHVFQQLTWSRLWDELKTLFMEGRVEQVLWYLENYDILNEIWSGLRLTHQQWQRLKRVDWALELFADQCDTPVQRWLLVLMVIFADLPGEELCQLAKEWQFKQDQRTRLLFAAEKAIPIKNKLVLEEITPSELYELLHPLRCEELMYLSLISDSPLLIDRLLEFVNHLKGIEVETSGKDIIDLGFSPGPLFKEVICEVKKAKLDGKIRSQKEELEFIKEYLKGKEGGCL